MASTKMLSNFLKDVKRNGVGYVKSTLVVKELKAIDPSVNVTYREEDKLYIVTYKK